MTDRDLKTFAEGDRVRVIGTEDESFKMEVGTEGHVTACHGSYTSFTPCTVEFGPQTYWNRNLELVERKVEEEEAEVPLQTKFEEAGYSRTFVKNDFVEVYKKVDDDPFVFWDKEMDAAVGLQGYVNDVYEHSCNIYFLGGEANRSLSSFSYPFSSIRHASGGGSEQQEELPAEFTMTTDELPIGVSGLDARAPSVGEQLDSLLRIAGELNRNDLPLKVEVTILFR